MSRSAIDKYDIKNSSLPKSEEQQNVFGYRDNLITRENYFSVKLINYSSVGWVFGLAQYGITPITTSSGTTEELYLLRWEDKVIYHGNDSDLTTGTNLNISNGYRNLQFTATDINASLTHWLLKDSSSTYKFFTVIVESSIVDTEPYDLKFEIGSDKTYTSTSQTLRNNYHAENIYTLSQSSTLKAIFERTAQDTTYNTQTIKSITIYGYGGLQPYTEKFINYEFLNLDKTTGTLSQGRWEGNDGDVLESYRIFYSPDAKVVAIELDFSQCDTNLDFNVDELWLSPDGINWEQHQLANGKSDLTKTGNDTFPLVFPITFGTTFANIDSDFSLYYRIVSKKQGTYIDCSGEDRVFKIKFYLA